MKPKPLTELQTKTLKRLKEHFRKRREKDPTLDTAWVSPGALGYPSEAGRNGVVCASLYKRGYLERRHSAGGLLGMWQYRYKPREGDFMRVRMEFTMDHPYFDELPVAAVYHLMLQTGYKVITSKTLRDNYDKLRSEGKDALRFPVETGKGEVLGELVIGNF